MWLPVGPKVLPAMVSTHYPVVLSVVTPVWAVASQGAEVVSALIGLLVTAGALVLVLLATRRQSS
ncbi:MAG: hypothetical protein C4297_09575 [Gemmataceae bacterium]